MKLSLNSVESLKHLYMSLFPLTANNAIHLLIWIASSKVSIIYNVPRIKYHIFCEFDEQQKLIFLNIKLIQHL